jgi:hypothetical protein
MHNDDDDNIFDEDDALDYIIYEDLEKEQPERQGDNGKGGCLGLLILLIFPPAAVLFWQIIV